MSESVIIQFRGVSADKYWDVNDVLGLDVRTGTGDWPRGMKSHLGSMNDDMLTVIEVWESRADQDAFMQTRLGPALAKIGLPEPSLIEWAEVIGSYSA